MKLKAYLEIARLTELAFAKKLGACQASVHYWASGERMPRPTTIRKIIRITSGAVRAEDFLPDEEQDEAA